MAINDLSNPVKRGDANSLDPQGFVGSVVSPSGANPVAIGTALKGPFGPVVHPDFAPAQASVHVYAVRVSQGLLSEPGELGHDPFVVLLGGICVWLMVHGGLSIYRV